MSSPDLGRVEALSKSDSFKLADPPLFDSSSYISNGKSATQHERIRRVHLQDFPITDVHSMVADEFPGERCTVIACGQPNRYSWSAVEHFLSRWRRLTTLVAIRDDGECDIRVLSATLCRLRDQGLRVGLCLPGWLRYRVESVLALVDHLSLELRAGGWADKSWRTLTWLHRQGVVPHCHSQLETPSAADQVLEYAQRLAHQGIPHFRVDSRIDCATTNASLEAALRSVAPSYLLRRVA